MSLSHVERRTATAGEKPGEKPGKIADQRGLFLIVIPAGGQMVALSVLLPRKA